MQTVHTLLMQIVHYHNSPDRWPPLTCFGLKSSSDSLLHCRLSHCQTVLPRRKVILTFDQNLICGGLKPICPGTNSSSFQHWCTTNGPQVFGEGNLIVGPLFSCPMCRTIVQKPVVCPNSFRNLSVSRAIKKVSKLLL